MSLLFALHSFVDSQQSRHPILHFPSCLRFADLDADGDYHLLCGTLEKNLKIYRGAYARIQKIIANYLQTTNAYWHPIGAGMSVLSKHVLLGIPVSVVSLFTDGQSPTPSVAVASGPYVFIYRYYP